MAKSSQIDIIINGIDNFTKTIGGAVDGIGKKLGDVGKTTASAFGVIGAAGLGTFATAATGVVGALGGIGLALGGMAKDAAGIEGVERAFSELASQAGTTGEAMLAAMQEGSGGTIAAADLMTQFNKAASLVNNQFATELPNAMSLVSKAAAATGQDMGFLMDSLVTGVGRVSPMILDNLGVQVDLTEATEAYAASHGLVAEELTKTEQQMAVQEMVMGKLQEKYGEMDSVYDTTASKMQQLQAGFTDFKNELGAAFMPVLTQLMDALMPIVKDMLYPMLGVVQALIPVFVGLMEALQPTIDVIVEFAQGIGEILDAFLNEDPERAIGAFTEQIGMLAEQLVETLPGIIEFGAELIMSIVQGIADSLPALMEAGMNITLTLIEMLIEMLPEMFNTGIDILLNLITGITNAFPDLMNVAIEAVMTLIMAIIKKLPDIINTGITVLQNLVDGILGAIPQLIAALPEVILALINTIVTLLPTILESGVGMLLALIDGIVAAIPDLVAAIPDIIAAMIDAIITLLPQILLAGVDIIFALIDGLIEAIPEIIAAIPDLIKAIIDTFKAHDWSTIGKDIVAGMKQGLENSWDSIKEKFGELLDKLPDWVKKMLGIDSPSKVFMEIGTHIPEGLAEGIKSAWELPQKAMKGLGAVTVGGFQSGVTGAGSSVTNNFNLTMPTSNNPSEVAMAFELMRAYGGV